MGLDWSEVQFEKDLMVKGSMFDSCYLQRRYFLDHFYEMLAITSWCQASRLAPFLSGLIDIHTDISFVGQKYLIRKLAPPSYTRKLTSTCFSTT